MATITYTFVSRCVGGDHVTMDVQVGAGVVERMTFDIDEVRAPLSELSAEQTNELKQLILRVHIAGKTRPQLVTEFANPVIVTI